MGYSTMCGTRTLVAKTCRRCNELKMACEYTVKGARHYTSMCTSCQYRSAKQSFKKANDASLEKATHHFQEWTSDEVDTLWRLTDLGLSTRSIAERLGRTEASVIVRKNRTRTSEESTILRYYDPTADEVFTVGKPFYLEVKGHAARLHKAASHLAELHTQLIFFIEVDEGGE